MSWPFSLTPCALFCAAVLYSGLFIYLTQAQQIEFNTDETRNNLNTNTNFATLDINDIVSGSISDISVNTLLPQNIDLIAAAGNPETPQPTLIMRANMNSGL